MRRNELCTCGSGKRYKHCHGREVPSGPSGPSAIYLRALALQQSGSLRQAETLYRSALEANPLDIDALHMLGVVQFERRRYREALDLLWDAAERTGWADALLRQNLGLVLAKLLTPRANVRQEALVAAYTARARAIATSPPVAAPVSVVLPVYNQADLIARAIASVAAQTYADIELVVVDDGSTDDTAAVIARCVSGLSFPARHVRTEHGGAALAANLGAERADGRYLAFLGADDWFAPQRIERMVTDIARGIPLWGFSQVASVGGDPGDDAGRSNRERVSPAGDSRAHEPVSFTLLKHSVSGPSGNLFVDRGLFRELGGYRDVPAHRGWDFCVRAAQSVEPISVRQRLYFSGKRGPGSTHAASIAAREIAGRTAELLASALTSAAVATNEFCPQYLDNRELLLRSELRAGNGDRIPVPTLRSLAATWRTVARAPAPNREMQARHQSDKVALVVLGMYRSGTSAFARALNLCGAALPERVIAARLGINPKGFWESEAITDLDVRLLAHLGADWNSLNVDVPAGGPLVDEFLASSREILATDYEAAPFILIKDPRICVLAALWHRALKESGYRPAYVVTVRHPLEVARSIEAQGDMSVADGLALWLAYMRRVELFACRGDARVVHVRYGELLDDWRRVVRRIARRLDVPLAIEPHADDVDQFLEAGMRNHQASDAELDADLVRKLGLAGCELYRRFLARCEDDVMATEGMESVADVPLIK